MNLKRAGSLSLVDMEHIGAEHVCVCLRRWGSKNLERGSARSLSCRYIFQALPDVIDLCSTTTESSGDDEIIFFTNFLQIPPAQGCVFQTLTPVLFMFLKKSKKDFSHCIELFATDIWSN